MKRPAILDFGFWIFDSNNPKSKIQNPKLHLIAVLFAAALCTTVVAGCSQGSAAPPQMALKPPEVDVCMPVYQEITDFEDFTGQTEAVKTIDIRARVTGYLKATHFKHGAEVKKGDLLFEIDPPYYEAEHARTEGVAAQAEARLKRLKLDYARAEENYSTRVITKAEFDQWSGDLAEAEANLKAAKASLKIATVNLGYCTIRAPIDGRLSRPAISDGNLVKADDTMLTTIVAQDPIWVYFDIDERTMLRLRRVAPSGYSDTAGEADLPMLIGLADEGEDYPHEGKLNFEDNRLDPSTGTLRVRGEFSNADRLLRPGLFVRVRLPIGQPYQALLVPEQAVGTDQGQKFIYVVNSDNKVTYRRVKVGKLREGLRVIADGITSGERIVTTGVQRVQPGMTVEAKLVQAETDSKQ
ncbi:MAG TPA: efflux RND transporter periplasmic adaptor subunit [Pirellulales bacterium]|nr:efflux RND transporter periplasmic adaptor subunit [Pirellulales bacterium]